MLGVHVGGPKCAYVKDARRMSYIYRHMINLVFSIVVRGSPSRLADVKVLESGARDNHVLCGSEEYQSEAIVASFLVQIVFPDCWPKIPSSNQNIYIGFGASVIQNFEFVVKGILGCVIFVSSSGA